MFLAIETKLKKILSDYTKLDYSGFVIDRPIDFKYGDIYTNIALIVANKEKENPKQIAEKIVKFLISKKIDFITKIESLDNGYINFNIDRKIFNKRLSSVLLSENHSLDNNLLHGKKFLIEHSSVNLFKPFHLGHLVNMTVGSAIANLYLASSAKVKTLSFPSDTGIHIACVIYYVFENNINLKNLDLSQQIKILGQSYVEGREIWDNQNKERVEEIKKIDNLIRDKKGKEYKKFLELKEINLNYLNFFLNRLNTKIDNYIFESQVSEIGKKIVLKHLGHGFSKSDQAIIFEGEKYGLHNRVFINSDNQAVYEAKDLGLIFVKSSKFHNFHCCNIVSSEIKEYSKVVLKAVEIIDSDLVKFHQYIFTGLMRLKDGKMSSREGKVLLIEDFLSEVKEKIKINFPKTEQIEIEKIAINILKHSILKSNIQKDKIFNFEEAFSLQGDSTHYLLYSYVRAKSIIKQMNENIFSLKINLRKYKKGEVDSNLEKLLFYSDIYMRKCLRENSLHSLIFYLTELATEFNYFYSKEKILDKENKMYHYNLIITKSFFNALKSGFLILGFSDVEKM